MIKVLILTDDIEGWTTKLEKELKAPKILKYKNQVIIQTELFYFHIQRQDVHPH